MFVQLGTASAVRRRMRTYDSATSDNFGRIERDCVYYLRSRSMPSTRMVASIAKQISMAADQSMATSQTRKARGVPAFRIVPLSLDIPTDQTCLELLRYELTGRGVAFAFVPHPTMRIIIQAPAMEYEEVAELVTSIAGRFVRPVN